MNHQTLIRTLTTVACGAIATAATAQSDQRLVVPLSDPSRPAILEIALFMGDIHVEAYDGNEVIVVADTPLRGAGRPEPPRPDGLTRIQSSSMSLNVEEDENTVSVRMDFSPKDVDLEIQVPRRTSVHASLVNGGDVEVIGVDGQHELSNVNGDIIATDVSGSAVINSNNGDVLATFRAVDTARPMSVASFNGDVDVSFPAALAADLIVATQQGEVFTDFEVVMEQDPAVVERNQRGWRVKNTTRYAINGGGPDIQLRTFNGDIMIRKR